MVCFKLKHGRAIGLVLFIIAGLLVSCSQDKVSTQTENKLKELVKLTPYQAREQNYPYAFSAQLVDKHSEQILAKFQVHLLDDTQSVMKVVNSMGDANGIFHISNSPLDGESLIATYPLVVTADGYDPVVQVLAIGTDCRTQECLGKRPLIIPLTRAQGSLITEVSGISSLTAKSAAQTIQLNGARAAYERLVTLGKIDAGAQSLFKGAKNSDVLSNILVVLKPVANESNLESTVNRLLSSNGGLRLKNQLAMPGFLPLLNRSGAEHSRVEDSMAAKRLFAAQLMNGIASGDFKGLRVDKDLQKSKAVIVSGQAQDLFKLAHLPNIQKLVALGHY